MDYESTAHLAPAPAYALESSDGESDYEEDDLASSRVTAPRRRTSAPEAQVTLEGAADRLGKGREAVFLVGEAGERIAQGVHLPPSGDSSTAVSVLVDGQQAGLITAASDDRRVLVFLSTALPLAALSPLAACVLELLEPTTVTVLASYHLPSYIPPTTPTAAAAAPPVLYLASPAPSPAVSHLVSSGALQHFTPPNLLHGLAAAVLTLSTLADSVSNSTLLLLPTTTPPPPWNGPFPPTSPIPTTTGGGSTSSMYDAGGPTGLGEPGALFREVAGAAASRGVATSRKAAPLRAVKEALGWNWWDPAGRGGLGFAWLEQQRKQRRRTELSSMYM
ncbi:hypothetical protein JCM3774_006800 [Rhodotorula dairenensis]